MASLSDDQRRALSRRALRWIFSIERLNQAGDRLNADPAKRYMETIDELHLLMIALEHVAKCARILRAVDQDSEFRRLCDTLFVEWDRVKFIRDGVEHEEEYIAGPGRFLERASAEWRADGYQFGVFIWDGDGIDPLTALGKPYHVNRAIRASLALKQPMAQRAEVQLS